MRAAGIIAIVLGLDTSHLSILGIAGAFTVVFFMGMGLSALYTMLALRSSDWQTQMAIINLLNLPLIRDAAQALDGRLRDGERVSVDKERALVR